MSELPPDPDLDDLPRELAERGGPLVISGVDPEDGTHYAAFVTKGAVAVEGERRIEGIAHHLLGAIPAA